MQGDTLAIYDKEEAYVEALSDYLNKNMELGIVTVAFSDSYKLVSYLEEGKSSYVILGEGFDKDSIKGKISEDKIISLVNTKEIETNGPWIYKYQSAKAITKELKSIIIQDEEELISENNLNIIFSTKSSLERGEYTELLLSDLKNKGSVLYINMEQFQGQSEYRYKEGKGMSELIYYLKQGGEKLKWKFKSLIEREDVSGRIMPVNCPLDLDELTKEDVKTLLNLFKGLSEYDFILVNLGVLNLATFELIKAGSHIEIVVTRKKGDRESAENLISHFKRLGMADVERRVEIIEFGTDTWI
ncbi:MAG: hypothetical protein ACTTG8_02070 [Catonella sp.]|uniref:hypothetical protein n=1 Tax=Catonella sp. TaxID=2382125 RepID=UPI003FA0A952